MSKMNKKTALEDGIKVHGFFRLQIIEDENGKEKVVGDSGWNKNTVTNLGVQDYLIDNLIGNTGEKSVTHAALGTGGAPGATDTTLSGEVVVREEITGGTSIVSSKTAQWTGQFASADSFVTNTQNISNIGLFNTSTQGAATIFAGNTYASSSCATNQNVNFTYQIRFS